jgi:hypothetical protein
MTRSIASHPVLNRLAGQPVRGTLPSIRETYDPLRQRRLLAADAIVAGRTQSDTISGDPRASDDAKYDET